MISVLIANFNNGKFLSEAIESVYIQTLELADFEVIICDDCSTDGSIQILRNLQIKYNFVFLNNESNLGVGATKSRLVQASKGNWFIFLDSDDKLISDCLKKLWNQIKTINNENLSLLYANSMRLEENGTLTKWSRSKSYRGTLLQSKFEYPIFHPIIYSRKRYNLTEGIDKSLKSAEDFDLWYKMEEVGDIVFLNENLYCYRKNENGISQAAVNTTKWLQVMMDHAYCSANAAKRRGLNVRAEFDDFTEVIHNKLTSKQSKSTIYSRFKTKLRNHFRIV
jgi:glycosyltransferase involved in cell wall biosynthesis